MDISVWDSGVATFPASLAAVQSPPKRLYSIGERRVLDAPVVAIVGTRKPTDYGSRIAARLSRALAEAGACVVSGMAFGIDAVVHKAALEVGGRTVAVLGTAIDRPYPAAHRGLYKEIGRRGLVISESAPGAEAFKGCFPRRNRIIAGLSKLVIVVEADMKSGSLITAQFALDAGLSVAAVPGCIDSPNSAGANLLLRDGAHVIASIGDALSLAGLGSSDSSRDGIFGGASSSTESEQLSFSLSESERAVYGCVGGDGLEVDAIMSATKMSVNRCLAVITTLELKGLVVATTSGRIRQS